MFGPEYARSKGPAALEPLGIYLPGDKNYPGKERMAHTTRLVDWAVLVLICNHIRKGDLISSWQNFGNAECYFEVVMLVNA